MKLQAYQGHQMLILAGPRLTVPVVSIQTIPLLSRSVSASGRLGVGDSMVSKSTSLSQNSHVTPSYKMATVGNNTMSFLIGPEKEQGI
jgi:hypothetical protein